MFKRKKNQIPQEIPKPKKIQEPEVPEYEDEEYAEDEEDLETVPEEKNKKKEASIELTEEQVLKALENLSFRIGRIEHHLRLDYY